MKVCLVGVGGKSESVSGWLSFLDGDSACISSPSTLTKLPRRDGSGRLKELPKMPIPLANGPGFGREANGVVVNGEAGATSDSLSRDWDLSKRRSGGGLGPAVNKFTGRLHGVSGMFLLKPPPLGSSALRFFFEISPVDMKAAGSGLTSL